MVAWVGRHKDMPERMSGKKCQKQCPKKCQKQCQKICQKECPKICQKECQEICQKECQGRNVRNNVRRNVRNNVRRYVRKNVRRYVRKNVRRYVRQNVRRLVRKNAKQNVRRYVRRNVRRNARKNVKRYVRKVRMESFTWIILKASHFVWSTGLPGYIIYGVSNLYIPIGSMYGIFAYIWLKCMVNYLVNVGKYTIHGSYGIDSLSFLDLPSPVAWRMHRSTIRNLT